MSEIYLLDATGLELPKAAATHILSAGEQDRFAGFHSERRRREFLIGRFFLKATLTEFIPTRVKEFRCISPKTEVAGKPSLPGINFNLSHSGEVFILAIGKDAVGVDIEPVQYFDDETASFCLSQQQRKKIACSPHPERLATLLWCLREATGKLMGTGLADPERGCVQAHRRGGFVTVNGTQYAWALASSSILACTPWNESRSQVRALFQYFTKVASY